MNKIADSILDLIGNTPLLDMNHQSARVLAKLESLNGINSIKDRVAAAMIEDAEKRGLKKGATIIEATSGNLGTALAAICAMKGYKFIAVMLEHMSPEYRKLIQIFGGEVVLVESKMGTIGAIAKMESLLKEIPDSYSTRQFENPANVKVHYETTAEEIWRDAQGNIDFFVAGIGTGGTITGIGRKLKGLNPAIKVIGVEPEESPFLSEGKIGLHKIQGIGSGFLPPLLDLSILDEIVTIKGREAIETARLNARTRGILGGISSGAASLAAYRIAERNPNKTIVFIVPSSGERQISTELFL